MRRITVVVLACALTACPSPEKTSESQPPSPSVSIASGYEDLAAALFDEPPPGYVADAEQTKGVTLEQVVAGDDDPQTERLRLTKHGFLRGFVRTWTSDDDSENVVYAFVYEFKDDPGAQADEQDGIDQAKSDGNTFFGVPGIDGATGITSTPTAASPGDDSTFHAVVFVRGSRYFLVAIGGPAEHSSQEAIDLAVKMAAKAA